MSKPKEFVVVFPFDLDMEKVILVRKSKGPTPDGNPDGQAGFLNGLGGKIEPTDKSPKQAAIREFLEETGIQLENNDVRYLLTEQYAEDAIVHYFFVREMDIYAQLSKLPKTTDGDFLICFSVPEYCRMACIKHYNGSVWNVPYLVMMACVYNGVPNSLWPSHPVGHSWLTHLE